MRGYGYSGVKGYGNKFLRNFAVSRGDEPDDPVLARCGNHGAGVAGESSDDPLQFS